jgi:hypothetical protein
VFVNPPYRLSRERWVKRSVDEGQRRQVVLLIPAATETRITQLALSACNSVIFIRARVMFETIRPNGSALFGFGVCLAPIASLGVLMRPELRDALGFPARGICSAHSPRAIS